MGPGKVRLISTARIRVELTVLGTNCHHQKGWGHCSLYVFGLQITPQHVKHTFICQNSLAKICKSLEHVNPKQLNSTYGNIQFATYGHNKGQNSKTNKSVN